MKKRVVIGMSGGVDSSVAAYMLKEQGFEVVGLFMRNWDSALNNDFLGNPDLVNRDVCPQEEDYADAQAVCSRLGIPLHRADFIKEYWDNVFSHFIAEYKKGRTPNPDILCNKYIKFNFFAKYAFGELNADYIAMGHYARIIHTDNESTLIRGLDENKDQTYFLSELSQEQLRRTLFPIGGMEKTEVRSIANTLGLETANKKDSTGICFIGERDFKRFLENYIPAQKGKTLDIRTKEVVGSHDGVMYYTIGQRRGLNLGGQSKAYYVCDKDVKKNILYVTGNDDTDYIMNRTVVIDDFNWIPLEKPLDSFRCSAKFRYRQKDIPVTAQFLDNGQLIVKADHNVKAITIGQECVLYDGDVCLGGGVIEQVQK